MNILVLGGLGFIGENLSHYLLKNNYNVTIATRDAKKSNSQEINIIQIDWYNKESLERACKNVDLIIHAAGVDSKEALNNFEESMNFSDFGTSNLVKAAANQSVKSIIYLSSAHVYSDTLIGNISENVIPANNHPYAKSHLVKERHIIDARKRYGIDTLVLRLSNCFGAPMQKDSNSWSLLINDICKQAVVAKKIHIKSNVNTVRNFISMNSVLIIISFLLEINIFEKNKHNIINIGERSSLSITEVVTLVIDRLQNFDFYPKVKFDNVLEQSQFLNFETKILQKIGFNQYYPIEKEIDNLIKYCDEKFN